MLADDTKGLRTARRLPTRNWRNVIQVVFKCGWQLNVLQRMHVEVLLRCIPSEMRTKDAAAKKEGLVVTALQKRRSALGGLPVGCFAIRDVQWLPIRPILIILLGHLVAHPVKQAFAPGHWRPVLGRVLMSPGYRVGELAMRLMKNLATRLGSVAMLAKVLRNRHPVFQFRLIPKPREAFSFPIPAFVVPYIDSRSPQSGHCRHPRGVAQRRRTIGLLKEHSPRGEPIDIGSLGLRMAA